MAIIEFDIHIDEVENVAAIYDRIQVWRSATEEGTYVDLTSDEETAATIDGTVEGPWALDELTLIIALDGADARTVTFDGTDPLGLTDVLDQINDEFPDLALEVSDDTGIVRLISPTTGTQSILVLTGTGRATLGLSASRTNGTAARSLISANTDEYTFRDFDGTEGYWYKHRFYSSVTGAVSSFSTAQQEGTGEGLPGSAVVVGSVALANLSGEPIVGRRIIFVPVTPQLVSNGAGINYGVMPSVDRVTIATDLNGRAAINLVKGQRLKVFLEGTTFQREFVVPQADFDILTVASAEADPFSIVETPPMPIRVS